MGQASHRPSKEFKEGAARGHQRLATVTGSEVSSLSSWPEVWLQLLATHLECCFPRENSYNT